MGIILSFRCLSVPLSSGYTALWRWHYLYIFHYCKRAARCPQPLSLSPVSVPCPQPVLLLEATPALGFGWAHPSAGTQKYPGHPVGSSPSSASVFALDNGKAGGIMKTFRSLCRPDLPVWAPEALLHKEAPRAAIPKGTEFGNPNQRCTCNPNPPLRAPRHSLHPLNS